MNSDQAWRIVSAIQDATGAGGQWSDVINALLAAFPDAVSRPYKASPVDLSRPAVSGTGEASEGAKKAAVSVEAWALSAVKQDGRLTQAIWNHACGATHPAFERVLLDVVALLLVETRRKALEDASSAVPEIIGRREVTDIIRRGILALREKEPTEA